MRRLLCVLRGRHGWKTEYRHNGVGPGVYDQMCGVCGQHVARVYPPTDPKELAALSNIVESGSHPGHTGGA